MNTPLVEDTHYSILGLDPSASTDDDIQKKIQRAFAKLSKKYHPDKNDSPDMKTMYYKITQAREVLSDPNKRSSYDKHISAKKKYPKTFFEMKSQSQQHNVNVDNILEECKLDPELSSKLLPQKEEPLSIEELNSRLDEMKKNRSEMELPEKTDMHESDSPIKFINEHFDNGKHIGGSEGLLAAQDIAAFMGVEYDSVYMIDSAGADTDDASDIRGESCDIGEINKLSKKEMRDFVRARKETTKKLMDYARIPGPLIGDNKGNNTYVDAGLEITGGQDPDDWLNQNTEDNSEELNKFYQ